MEWVIEVLQETAEKFQPQLLQRLKRKLQRRELGLLNYVFPDYYQHSRFYDRYHILFSTHFAVRLARNDKKISPLIVPAIILHDVGYGVLSVKDKENWNDSQVRILHMQEGAAIAAKILIEVGGYNAQEIETIVGMVATHDNGYLDIETKNPDRLALIDADRIWVMHFISFYKDWSFKKISLKDFFQTRWLNFSEKPLTHELSRLQQHRQFEARYQEIYKAILADKNTFQRYAEWLLEEEVTN